MRIGTTCVKSGTLLREEWHHYVKNGTICVKSGTVSDGRGRARIDVKTGTLLSRNFYLRENRHFSRRAICVKNGTLPRKMICVKNGTAISFT
ncbi:hypothetical protein GCM10027346_43200 [Hymenobacter seoulensis]